MLTQLFESDRNYLLGDPELEIIGDREKLAQWRHKMKGPAFYRNRPIGTACLILA